MINSSKYVCVDLNLYETVLMMYMYVCVCMFVCLHEQGSLRKGQGECWHVYPVRVIIISASSSTYL